MDIHGWIELTALDVAQRGESYAWAGVIRLDYLIGWYDIVAVALFRFRPATPLRGEPELPSPIAAERGLPSNPSEQVTAELDEIKRLEETRGAGEIGGYTHVYWEEIENVDWRSFGVERLQDSPWFTVFNLVRVLKASSEFAHAGIRIVCWRNW